jgi:flavin-dependent dehydrogenase
MNKCDVLIVGAGPAGTVAGAILARAGVRVRLVDRATFPRDKLCGDTINPGALATLRRLGLGGDIERRGLPVGGMRVTGEGVEIEGRYPAGLYGYAMLRRDLDGLLLEHAVTAGCHFEPNVHVQHAIVREVGRTRSIGGVAVGGRGSALSAPVTIAADGRRSAITFGLGLARHPDRPRRWAIGAYFENFAPVDNTQGRRWQTAGRDGGRGNGQGRRWDVATIGEMHVRHGRYIGVAAVPGGLTNVCLVKPSGPGDVELRDPGALLTRELARDPMLRDRAAGARLAAPPVVLGPLAVDVRNEAIDGLLLAGDAAGFIDPMTGDGLRFAIGGGELAAAAALRALERGWAGVHADLDRARRHAFGGKWLFNRALRALVTSPRAVDAARVGARVAPALLRAVIARAGDCHVVG